MAPAEFDLKWRSSTQTERAASQEHFIDLCCVENSPQILQLSLPTKDSRGVRMCQRLIQTYQLELQGQRNPERRRQRLNSLCGVDLHPGFITIQHRRSPLLAS